MSHQLASWDAPISWNVQFSVSLESRNLKESTIPMKIVQPAHSLISNTLTENPNYF